MTLEELKQLRSDTQGTERTLVDMALWEMQSASRRLDLLRRVFEVADGLPEDLFQDLVRELGMCRKCCKVPAQVNDGDEGLGPEVCLGCYSEGCNPPQACETHGRCWTHSEWESDWALPSLSDSPEATPGGGNTIDQELVNRNRAALSTHLIERLARPEGSKTRWTACELTDALKVQREVVVQALHDHKLVVPHFRDDRPTCYTLKYDLPYRCETCGHRQRDPNNGICQLCGDEAAFDTREKLYDCVRCRKEPAYLDQTCEKCQAVDALDPEPEAPTFGSWVKFEDRPPALNQVCLVVCRGHVQTVGWRYLGFGWTAEVSDVDDAPSNIFSHWMPFPAAPPT